MNFELEIEISELWIRERDLIDSEFGEFAVLT